MRDIGILASMRKRPHLYSLAHFYVQVSAKMLCNYTSVPNIRKVDNNRLREKRKIINCCSSHICTEELSCPAWPKQGTNVNPHVVHLSTAWRTSFFRLQMQPWLHRPSPPPLTDHSVYRCLFTIYNCSAPTAESRDNHAKVMCILTCSLCPYTDAVISYHRQELGRGALLIHSGRHSDPEEVC